MAEREYDVVLHGAGGFTGRQTVAYFARHAPAGLRWAIAGTSRARLEAARADAGGPAVDLLVADSGDQSSVDAVVRRARVLLSTAGPYARYGTPVVDACVRFGTHHVNITGEAPWVRELIASHHRRAADEGTRVVPFCGFDSVPSDLGVFLVARRVRDTFGVGCREVHGYFRMKGGLNGGTLASLVQMVDSGSWVQMRQPFLLDPPMTEHTRDMTRRSRDLTKPCFDPLAQAWVAPFVMAPVNTRVVRRSASLFAAWKEPYGEDFVYQESQRFGRRARVAAWGWTLAVGAALAALRRRTTRRLLSPLLPEPGAGPSERTMDDGWFVCDLIGVAEDGRHVRGRIRHRGDPGNRATVRFVCESALALAIDADRLPGGPTRGGILTPATAFGDVLADRLRSAGVEIDVEAG
jgi:short subunit dehydrogenase-like uncharacterized protein